MTMTKRKNDPPLSTTPEATLDSLAKLLEADDVEVRWDAILALENIPGPEATELLTRALRDDRFISIRYKAATALGTRGDPRAIDALVAALDDPEFYVREKAAEALGRIGGIGAVEPLLEAYSDRDPDVKRRITRALIEIGPPAEKQLQKAAESKDPAVREAAKEVLGEIEARRRRRG
jgi:HEAT repeat protein